MSPLVARLARALTLTLILAAFTGCAATHLDPSGGGEVVMIRTADHPDAMEIRYDMANPAHERMVLDKHSYTLLWVLPVNRPAMWQWLRESLPPGTSAANISAQVRTPWYGYLVFVPTLGLVRIEKVRFEADAVEVGFPQAPPAAAP